jgi:riboflavin kinase/FMN adenylyltransferase
MQILEGISGLRQLPPGAIVSIGNFDGLHRGHRHILQSARALGSAAHAGVAVVTFEPHPLTVLRPEKAPPRLTPRDLKRALLDEAGVDYLVELPPTPEVLDLTAEQFWQILRDEVRPAHLVEGSSFYFGKGRGGSARKLCEWSMGTGVRVDIVDPCSVVLLNLAIVPASSSLIRWLLGNGRVRDAAICLGRGYDLVGEVVGGHRRGRTLGVPTANLRIIDQVVPADGVYSGRSTVDGASYAAAVSIGTLPTFDETARQIEAHLIGFDGDLYGRTLRVELTDWLREQRKYSDVEALVRQIRQDLKDTLARKLLRPEESIGTAHGEPR